MVHYSCYIPFFTFIFGENGEIIMIDKLKNFELIETHLKPRSYFKNEIVRIINPKQKDLYIKHGVYPIDIYNSVDNDGKDIIVYIFLKSETRELYYEWNNRTLE